MKCFYHADNDGKCAGFWVYRDAVYYDGYGQEFIQINYGTKFPLNTIKPDEQVFIVDYSIEVEEMRELLKITKDVTWIDHHISAIEKYNGFEIPIKGIRYDGIAGCMLTYIYLNIMTSSGTGEVLEFDPKMVEHAPRFTQLIADWDVWAFKFGDETRQFNMGMEIYEKSPESKIWSNLLTEPDFVDKIIEEGKLITKYRDQWAKMYCESKGFEVEFEGYRCFAMNLGYCNSEYFNSINESEYDILISFCFDKNIWTYSLYSSTVNVAKIAQKYGGGGHKGASGFQSKEVIFNK
jgi:oligoribonuclease NrnB/cAMP/cGMP phosphodiesterase (DHH superfamily)